MPLDFAVIQPRIAQLIAQDRAKNWDGHVASACDLLREASARGIDDIIDERQLGRRIPWLVARSDDDFGAATPATDLGPPTHTVIASDGSLIPPDRHSPLRFFVLNSGLASLTYGPVPGADLWSCSRFCSHEDELYIQTGSRRVPVETSLLGVRMALEEMEVLSGAIQEASSPMPLLALRDGSLILWALQSEEDTVIKALVEPFLEAMNRIETTGAALASYISFPNARDVCNSLRLLLCDSDPRQCGSCSARLDESRDLCLALGEMRDRTLFDAFLEPGQRSAVFDSSSSILDRYGHNRVQFFYLHVGDEIARVEAPAWVTQDAALLDFVHACLVDQCQLGDGYPPALIEAHEQAVITTGDRRLVEQLVEEALAAQGLAYVRSAKDRSKRHRGV